MRKFFGFIKNLFFAAKIIIQAVVAPVAILVARAAQGKPTGLGLQVFAFWRLFVWLFFLLCVFGSIGVPAVLAYLFLTDLAIVGVQIVMYAVEGLQEKPQ